jgi:hypothetical protein
LKHDEVTVPPVDPENAQDKEIGNKGERLECGHRMGDRNAEGCTILGTCSPLVKP